MKQNHKRSFKAFLLFGFRCVYGPWPLSGCCTLTLFNISYCHFFSSKTPVDGGFWPDSVQPLKYFVFLHSWRPCFDVERVKRLWLKAFMWLQYSVACMHNKGSPIWVSQMPDPSGRCNLGTSLLPHCLLTTSPVRKDTSHWIFLLLYRFNRLSVDSVDESSFAHLPKLQVLDISAGTTDLPFNREKIEGDKMLQGKEEDEET